MSMFDKPACFLISRPSYFGTTACVDFAILFEPVFMLIRRKAVSNRLLGRFAATIALGQLRRYHGQ